VSTTTVDPTTLELPASEPWPAEADALARVCGAVTTLRVDVYGLRELHANRPWKGAARGFFQRLSVAPQSDLLLAPSRAQLLGAIVEAATLGERLGLRALALVDEARALDALRERFPNLVTVRVGTSVATLRAPSRDRDAELFALVDSLAARGVRSEFED
jgi:hypothetical protein